MDKLIISEEHGYQPFNGENGMSSTVFEKDGDVFKLTKRNTVKRAGSDYLEWQKIMKLFKKEERLQSSEILNCKDGNGKSVTCVKQKKIQGQTLKDFGKKALVKYLEQHPSEKIFLKYLVDVFYLRVELNMLYPDLVGNPEDQSLWNSINLMIEPERGIVLCDVGLSPHDDTLEAHGQDFFKSNNVKNYVKQVKDSFYELIEVC